MQVIRIKSYKKLTFLSISVSLRTNQHEFHHKFICEQEYRENEIWFHFDDNKLIQQDNIFYFYVKEFFHRKFDASYCLWDSENSWTAYKNYNRSRFFIYDRILKWFYTYSKNFMKYKYCISSADRWSNRTSQQLVEAVFVKLY